MAPGPATTAAYTGRVNEGAAQRLATNTAGKGNKWLQAAQAGIQR